MFLSFNKLAESYNTLQILKLAESQAYHPPKFYPTTYRASNPNNLFFRYPVISPDMDNRVVSSVPQSSQFWHRFMLSEIQSATNNFSETMLIGQGGFGKVYKGFIDDGAALVAIKRLNPESKQGAGEFWTEIKTLYGLRHPHLITLIGYSDDNDEMILVYECMSNGNLADHLYKNRRNGKGRDMNNLTWKQRLHICIGAAHGLDYLHEGTEQSVIHRDVKTTNILLDSNWVPKISDFGLSKMGVSQIQTHVSTDVKGTFGYLDPQYFLTRRLTKKSDVYAFGVVLFEVLCGRPPLDFRVEDEKCSLAQWAQKCMKKGIIAQIIDPSLSGQMSPNSLKMFAEVANRCLHNHPKGRPTMAEVARTLELVLASTETMPLPKGMIIKVPSTLVRCFVEGFKIVQRKLKLLGCKNSQSVQSNTDPFTGKAMQVFRCFTFKEIRAATNNFDEDLVVGKNVYSTVYRGLIDNGNLQVAVKRWKEGTSNENLNIFYAEIRVQAQLQYRHLVPVIGYCTTRNELITVYEFMVNGSLHMHLHESHDPLPWKKRLEICIDAARGLHYLHAGTRQPIIHRNLKPANILLDQDWVAKLAILEVPAILPQDLQSASFDPLVACTVGYMDPEYILSGRFSVKSDVYSFGTTLLELLCGRQPMIYTRDENQVNLVRWFNINMEMGTLDEIIDHRLIDQIAPECLKEYVHLAELCTRNVGIERPSMETVLDSLRYALQMQEAWQDFKHSGADFVSQDLSQKNSFPEGILVVATTTEGGPNQLGKF